MYLIFSLYFIDDSKSSLYVQRRPVNISLGSHAGGRRINQDLSKHTQPRILIHFQAEGAKLLPLLEQQDTET